jgi:hypothetical protein
VGHAAYIGEKSTKMLVGKPEGRGQLGTPRRIRDDIRVDLKKIRWESVDSTHAAQNNDQRLALVNTGMKRKTNTLHDRAYLKRHDYAL